MWVWEEESEAEDRQEWLTAVEPIMWQRNERIGEEQGESKDEQRKSKDEQGKCAFELRRQN